MSRCVWLVTVLHASLISVEAKGWKGTLKVINESGSVGEAHLSIRGRRVSGSYEILKDEPEHTSRLKGQVQGKPLNPRKRRQRLKMLCRTSGNNVEIIEIEAKLVRKGERFLYKGTRFHRERPESGVSEPNHFVARLLFGNSGYVFMSPSIGESVEDFRANVQREFDEGDYTEIVYIPTDAAGKWSYPDIWEARSRGTFTYR